MAAGLSWFKLAHGQLKPAQQAHDQLKPAHDQHMASLNQLMTSTWPA